ncbi:MAG: 6-carboxytetrahydropterin synthase [Deltaproteobacteria bacterium]|nr:6-carboxytetrahydropterin synthase [Deltaproteobacteria bacterium]
MQIRLDRRYRFTAGHLYRRPEWSEEENLARFGKCAILPGHGHNYRLYVRVAGEVDPKTGFVVDLPALDACVQETIIDRLDHRHINEAVEEFSPGRLIPSSENLLLWMCQQLQPAIPVGVTLISLRLEEDEDLAAEWISDP